MTDAIDGVTSEGGDRGNGDPRRLELTFPAVHRRVRMARNLVRRFARMDGLPVAELDTLVLVTSELLENAVDHGGGDAAREEQELKNGAAMNLVLAIDGEGWELTVSDQGGGDPDALAQLISPDGLPDLEDERGRGFFLLSTMVDEMKVGPSADARGVEVRVIRRVPDDSAQ